MLVQVWVKGRMAAALGCEVTCAGTANEGLGLGGTDAFRFDLSLDLGLGLGAGADTGVRAGRVARSGDLSLHREQHLEHRP
jgi:hypothetical protein